MLFFYALYINSILKWQANHHPTRFATNISKYEIWQFYDYDIHEIHNLMKCCLICSSSSSSLSLFAWHSPSNWIKVNWNAVEWFRKLWEAYVDFVSIDTMLGSTKGHNFPPKNSWTSNRVIPLRKTKIFNK